MLNDGVSGKNDSSGLNLVAAITSPIAVLLTILIIVGLIILKKKELGDLVKRFQDRCTRSTGDIGMHFEMLYFVLESKYVTDL